MKNKDYEQLATQIMMNALEGVKAQIRKAYDKGYTEGYVAGYDYGKQDGYKDGKTDTPFTDTEEAEKKAYEDGMNLAWECARKIAQTMKRDEITTCFGERDEIGRKMIFEEYSASEAIAKIKAYEDKQKQDAEIKVGDEVYSDAFDDKGIVTHITTDKVSCVCIICNGFTMMKVGTISLHKTGRHFDQIAEILAELRGAE